MADRSHLTPVQTADKRGRLTTVYRNLAATVFGARSATGGADAGRGIPSLPPAAPAPGKPTSHDAAVHRLRAIVVNCVSGEQVEEAFSTDEGEMALSLAVEAVASGRLRLHAVEELLVHTASWGAGYSLDMVRLFTALPVAIGWGVVPFWVVGGMREGRLNGPSVLSGATEAETAAALVRFMNHAWLSDDDDMSFVVKTREAGVPCLRVPHATLEALVRRRPGDAERIAEYLLERSRGTSHPEVADIEAWLDSETPALADGLL